MNNMYYKIKQAKKIYTIIIFSFLFLFLFSCSLEDKYKLEKALRLAGENRTELEKVLEHYKNDSLKYKSAVFLIENMPYYSSIISSEADSIKTLMSQFFNKWDYTEQERQKGLQWQKQMHFTKKEDIKEVKAEMLIENIDLAFKVWREKPWNKNLSFEDFCELILPYRIKEEPLSSWRKKYYEKYNPILDSLYKGRDAVEACNILSNYIKQEKFFFLNDFVIPRQGAEFQLNNRIGVCRDACDATIYIMRSVGIPVTVDLYPCSPEYHSGHQWNVVRDTTGRFLPFLFDEYRANRDIIFSDKLKKAKVYRMVYGIKPLKKTSNIHFPSNSLYLQDVTKEYFGENRVVFPFEKSVKDEIFLGVFTAREGWFPVGEGKIVDDKLIFENIEPFVIYQPLTYNKGKLIPIYYPFMYEKNNTLVFSPQKETESVVLTRKYPLRKENTGKFKTWLKGIQIKGADNKHFSHSELLYKMNELPPENVIYVNINPKKEYSYFQYEVQKDSVLSIAEIHFFKEDNKEIFFDTIYSNGKPWKDIDMYQLKNCNDNDPVSFFHTWEKGTSIFFVARTPQKVNKIKLIPRNDDNFIREGDVYELFYNNGDKGWISLGKQKATKDVLYYNVPKNTVLWLKNHTRGIEEQIFFMKDHKQVFISDLK